VHTAGLVLWLGLGDDSVMRRRSSTEGEGGSILPMATLGSGFSVIVSVKIIIVPMAPTDRQAMHVCVAHA